MDNYTNGPDSVEIYYPREATIFASICAVVFSVLGVIGKYNPSKSHDKRRGTNHKAAEYQGQMLLQSPHSEFA